MHEAVEPNSPLRWGGTDAGLSLQDSEHTGVKPGESRHTRVKCDAAVCVRPSGSRGGARPAT